MTTTAISALPPPSSTPSIPVGPVTAAAPVAAVSAIVYAASQAELPLPTSQPHTAPAGTGENPDGAAMRPDQLFMARQMSFQRADAGALAGGWRTMVKQYGSLLVEREQRVRTGHLAPATLIAAQEGRRQLADGRPADPTTPADPWRFTVHAGGLQPQDLRVVGRDPDPPPGRRRSMRLGLRLELMLEDGTRVAVQLEPMAGGVALELAAPGAPALARLRRLEPAITEAIERTGLRIVRRRYTETLTPGGIPHAFLAAHDATSVLTLPVFKAIAELALLLPAYRRTESGQLGTARTGPTKV